MTGPLPCFTIGEFLLFVKFLRYHHGKWLESPKLHQSWFINFWKCVIVTLVCRCFHWGVVYTETMEETQNTLPLGENCHTVSVNTPKLESCRGVSVSFYDVALEDPWGSKGQSLGHSLRARISNWVQNIQDLTGLISFRCSHSVFWSGVIHVSCT